MLFKKFQLLAQWIGFLTIAGFALYGVVTLGSGRAWAVGNAAPSAITIPSTFNYQGFLRDDQGNAITGTRKLKVSLWTAVTAGTELYTETFTGVSVRDGLFNVVMGSTQNMSPTYFQNVAPLFVGVSVDDAAELIPRQRIHPVPWALTSTTLVPDASVTNLTNNGSLYVSADKQNYIGPSENPAFVDGLFFWGNKGFAWIAKDANGYLMTLKQDTGGWIAKGLAVGGTITSDVNVNVGNNLSLAGAMFVNGESPILIKQFIDQPHGEWVDTGIPYSKYNCTMGSWIIRMDINESAVGDWFRYVERNATTGNWDAMSRSVVHSTTPSKILFDVVCFHVNISQWTQQSAARSAVGFEDAPLQLDVTADETGQ